LRGHSKARQSSRLRLSRRPLRAELVATAPGPTPIAQPGAGLRNGVLRRSKSFGRRPMRSRERDSGTESHDAASESRGFAR
jgi:hypothetical protein